ncbi:hypothetical protein J4416_01210 [Candidatus Pacearchaeota archaeon]|nr:hypothetical protein [Candidatus Pacearchaeota archaeon]
MEYELNPTRRKDYIQRIADVSGIIENAAYVLTEGGERSLVESALVGLGNRSQSRSQSSRSAGMSARTYGTTKESAK